MEVFDGSDLCVAVLQWKAITIGSWVVALVNVVTCLVHGWLLI